MNKGTILYVGNFELPDKGASANRVMSNRKLLRELGYETAFLGITREASFDGIRRAEYDGNTFERAYPASTQTWLRNAFSLADIKKAAAYYADLKAIILYNTPYFLLSGACAYFHRKGIRVLYDCTEWNSDTEGNILKKWYKKLDARLIRRYPDRKADGLILVSSMMYEHYGKKPKLLLPPLVDPASPLWAKAETRNAYGFEFCYAGDPGKKDDLCRMIDAYRALDVPDARLTIIGLNEDTFLTEHPEYKAVLNSFGTNLRFLGRLPHEQVVRHLKIANCFIFIREPNLRNNAGFPTKFVEAYSGGIPIIASDISDIRAYVSPAVYVLKANDTESIAEAMRQAMDSTDCPKQRDAFDYRRYCTKAARFLADVIGPSDRRKP